MVRIPPLPMLPPLEQRPVWVETLLEMIAAQQEQIHQLREENQALRDEIAVLKKQSPRPQIRPSKLNEIGRDKGKSKRKGKRKKHRHADQTVVIEPEHIPEGSRFKGYSDFWVQDLVIATTTTLYRIKKWLTPDGHMVSGQLPAEARNGHYGPTLYCFILYQYYHAQVTEPLILEQVREWAVEISSGQLHRLITEGKEYFHREKDHILRVGLRVSGHIQTDDTGARHQGKNGYCTYIGNEWFAWFQSTDSKSRINFLQLLRADQRDYVLSGQALEYMAAQKLPKQVLSKLSEKLQDADKDLVFNDSDQWGAALASWNIRNQRHIRIATEGALLASALMHGLNPKLGIVSDDAGQFNVLCHALCWIHAERVLAKLMGFNDPQRQALEQVRTAVWQLYRDLQAYQSMPTVEAKQKLEQRFDTLCKTKTTFFSLNSALERMGRNKAELLMVLERPELPLHNNLSESDIREYVKRRKISGGTRSELGRQCRDTFASLKKTARKLGVSFWDYLTDRITGAGHIAPLPSLIEACAHAP
jgi:hypothetical protein